MVNYSSGSGYAGNMVHYATFSIYSGNGGYAVKRGKDICCGSWGRGARCSGCPGN
ncbi:hypothetical protein HYX11_05420 [Candidatus Woesearchaeota archaeon]|nr:hypothetical protein [Candidatus Woesearchaeota archaeon]